MNEMSPFEGTMLALERECAMLDASAVALRLQQLRVDSTADSDRLEKRLGATLVHIYC